MNDARKIIVCMLVFLLLPLTACGLDMLILDENTTEDTVKENIQIQAEQKSSEEENQQQESVKEKYKDILLGNRDFICVDLENLLY